MELSERAPEELSFKQRVESFTSIPPAGESSRRASIKGNGPSNRIRRGSVTTAVVSEGIEVTIYDTDAMQEVHDLNAALEDIAENKFVVRKVAENDKHKRIGFYEISSTSSNRPDESEEYKEMTMRELLDQLVL